MANMTFDTLTASKSLHKAGFGTAQAEAIALVIKDSQGELATKSDVDLVRADVDRVRAELDLVRTELGLVRTELGADIESLQAKLTADNESLQAKLTTDNESLQAKLTADNEKLRTELEARISGVESGLTWLKWVVGVQMAVMIGGFGIMVGGFGMLFSRLPMP